ncbi:MAG: hypothetical protein AB6733_13190 [Clostridiaceae bacterium]
MEITIISILMFLAIGFSFFVTVGYENFRGITVELDKVYDNTSEMAYAVRDELKHRGKQCEIVEIGKGYPKLLVNEKIYTANYKVASVSGFPVQVIQLRPCK